MSSQRFLPSRVPLQHWRVDWFTDEDRFEATKAKWWWFERSIPERLEPLFQWVYKKANGDVRDIGATFSDIFYARLGVGDDADWHFAHALGRGGFGAVAMFEKRDSATLELKDQLAVKTTQARRDLAVEPDRIDLSLEAALMAQTNDIDEDGLLTLRQYKYYDQDHQWKYYFEYCPFGDLDRLRIRYKAYGRRLPELFLWHLFYWLAKTMREYSVYNDWRDVTSARWGDLVTEGFLLHSDIKTQNVLLGPPDPENEDEANLYPIPRVADLGLAQIQSVHNPENFAARLAKGTHLWFPPEIRWAKMIQHSEFYPFGTRPNPDVNDRYRKARHKITSSANVWAVGAIMFSMATLRECDYLSKIVDNILNESVGLMEEFSAIIDYMHFSQAMPGYSQELLDLIRYCLRLGPDERPDEETLVTLALQGYEAELAKLQQKVDGDSTDSSMSLHDAVETLPEYRVYYQENEIENAPDNDRYKHPDRTPAWWTYTFANDFIWLPEHWGRLWPPAMPKDTSPPRHWPEEIKDAMRQTRAQVVKEREAEAQIKRDREEQRRQQQQQQQQRLLMQPALPQQAAQPQDANQGQLPPQPQSIVPAPNAQAGGQGPELWQPQQPRPQAPSGQNLWHPQQPRPQAPRDQGPNAHARQAAQGLLSPQQNSWGVGQADRNRTVRRFASMNLQGQAGDGAQRNNSIDGDVMGDAPRAQGGNSDEALHGDIVGPVRNRPDGNRYAPYFIPRRGER